MSDNFSTLALREDFQEAITAPDASRWTLQMPGDLEVFALMVSKSAPTDQFQARLLWARYPDDPPSLKFRDPSTGRLDLPQAWPIARGFRPQSLDACVNWCAEGFNLHPEWTGDPRYRWNPHGNPLLWVLRQLQEELDDHFQGRFK
jgi:hypothetical protein